MRTVTVFSTVGNKKKIVKTDATTWEELKLDLQREGVAYEGMRAIVGENQVTLESDKAKLPVGLSVGDETIDDFTLFLSAKKTKAGQNFPKRRILALLGRIKRDIETLENLVGEKEVQSVSKDIAKLSKLAREIESNISE